MIYHENGKPIAHFPELLELGDAVVQEIKNPETNNTVIALVTWGRNLTEEYVQKIDPSLVDFVKSTDSEYYEKGITVSI